MEMNVEKKKNEILKQPSLVQIMVDQKQLKNVDYFCSTIINAARCICEIKSMITMAKTACNRQKTFHQQIGLKF
jgi:hypothetical protein